MRDKHVKGKEDFSLSELEILAKAAKVLKREAQKIAREKVGPWPDMDTISQQIMRDAEYQKQFKTMYHAMCHDLINKYIQKDC